MRTALIFFCVLTSLPLFARLGETNQEILQRYGAVTRRESISTNEWTGFYQFNGYNVAVTFSNNISVVETVSPIIKRTMPADELDKLKKSIGGEDGWNAITGVNKTNDCVALTTTINGIHMLRVGRKSYIDSSNEAAKKSTQEDRQKKLERKTAGF
jgi:hypothetical protein